jgi:hypothetical protein
MMSNCYQNKLKKISDYQYLYFTSIKNNMKKTILFLIFSLVTISIYAQSDCATAIAFCGSDSTSPSLTFPNSTGGSGGPIACLNSTPNPNWFYFKVDQSGTLIFDIIQNTSFNAAGDATGIPLDVDFAVWGPFVSASANCGNINNTGCPVGCPNNTTNPGAYPRPLPSNLVDCSYDASPIEHMTIAAANPGQYYLAMITNFSGQSGFIKLEQRAPILPTYGSTDCDIVCSVSLGPDRTECEATPIDITTTFASTPTSGTPPFQWFLNGVLQPAYNNMQTIINITQPGTWSVKTTRPGGCYEVTDSMLLTYITIPVTQPTDIVLCTNSVAPYVFPSINKNTQILGALPASDYTITYHTTQIDAENGVASIPFANLTNYSISTSPVRIFVRIEDNNTGCITTRSFNLIVTATPAGTFSYSGNPYTSDMATAQAITHNGLTSGGVFTSTPAGLSINTTTGEIIPSMSTPGTYTVNYDIAASASCPAFNTTTTVTVDTMPVGDVTQNSGILSAVQSGSTYKWYKCPNTLLPAETNQSYTPTVAGDYKVVITLGNYTVTSACVMVTTLSTSEFQLHSKFRLYSNPNKGILNIDSEVNGEILIVNQLGQVVKKVIVKANTANSINIHELTEGTYFVKGTNKMNIGTQKLIIKK